MLFLNKEAPDILKSKQVNVLKLRIQMEILELALVILVKLFGGHH